MMIKKMILSIAILALLTGCSTNEYKISGTLSDIESGTVYLKKVMPSGIEEIDTTEVSNGKFEFSGQVEHPELYLIFYEEQQAPIALFLENTNISISGEITQPEDVKITGSKLNNIFKRFNEEIPHMDKVEEMREEYFIAQSSNDETTMESIMADMQVIVQEQQDYYHSFVKENSDNVVGAFFALNMAQSLSYDELEELVQNLEANLEGHPYLSQLQEIMEPMQMQKEAESALEIGKEAPSFTLPDLNGEQVTLEDFKGKYVFVDFWAAWCRPCRVENPILKRAYDQYGGNDFEIISISLDETEEAWKKAVEEDGLNWTLLHDPVGNVAQTYNVQSIPNTWLLDRQGNIIQKQIKGEELIELLATLVEE